MSLEKTDGIVLRAVPWSETSLVVTLWTRDFGKLSAIARGARRLRSPFESALDLLAHSSVVFLGKSGDALDLLTEAKLVRRFKSGQRRLVSLYCGYYVAEVLLFATEEGVPIPELFDLSQTTLAELDGDAPAAEVTLRFELQALRHLGHQPNLEQCVHCGESVRGDEPRVSFSIDDGGVWCQRCPPTQRSLVRVRRATLDALASFGHPDALARLPELGKALRGEVRGLMNRYWSSLYQRAFRLHPFLGALGR